MSYPITLDKFQDGEALCHIKASDLVTIANMLNGLTVEMVQNQDYAEVVRPADNGVGWKLRIPAGSGGGALPSNAGKSKYMVPTLSADNATAEDDPDLWIVDWVRAHA